MKRGLDYEELPFADAVGGAAPGGADDSMTLRLSMSNGNVGTIIGKGGTNIKGIREAAGCKISIAEVVPGLGERSVSVTGSSASVAKATELMLDVLDEARPPDEVAAAAAAAAAAAESESPAPAVATHSLKLLLSHNQVGGIIGKGGATIKQFREESGASIKAETMPSATNERICSIQGSKMGVVRACSLIIGKLSTMPAEDSPHPTKFQRTNAGPRGGAPPYATPYGQQQPYGVPGPYAVPGGGYGGQPGFGAAGGYGAQPAYGQQPGQFGQQPSPYAQQPAQYGQQQQQYAGQPGFGAPTSFGGGFDAYGQQQPAPAAAGYGGGGGAGAVPSVPPPIIGNGTAEQMVPQQLAGRLIGRGGSGIRELRDVSQAMIKIASECEPGTEMRKITVTGTPEQMQMALGMIATRVAQGP